MAATGIIAAASAAALIANLADLGNLSASGLDAAFKLNDYAVICEKVRWRSPHDVCMKREESAHDRLYTKYFSALYKRDHGDQFWGVDLFILFEALQKAVVYGNIDFDMCEHDINQRNESRSEIISRYTK